MKIDKIFVINLEHRVDRKNAIIKEFQRVGINNYEFFKAVQPNEQMISSWNPNFINPLPNWLSTYDGDIIKYKIGSLGCMLSHIEIIKICVKNNYENVLIFEDDTIFNIKNGIKFDAVIDTLQSQIKDLSYGLLYLAGNHRAAILEKISDNIHRVLNTYTTGSYIVNKQAMQFILNRIPNYPREVDHFYANIVQKEFPCYCIQPHITTQADGYSDILQKDVAYKL